MHNAKGMSFLQGLTAGAFGSFIGASALLYIMSRGELVSFSAGHLPSLGHWLDWAYTNLGSSIPVFALLLGAFFFSLARLRSHLDQERPINEVVQLDHLTDIWTTLFFGTGVIWTAIGMRSALLFALGDPDDTVQQGAFAVLKRMVDGGILLALSTTIFGGIGGYLMRVYKSVALGAALQQAYDTAARVDTSSMKDTLERIEEHLSRDRDGPDKPSTGDNA
ncbi:MAG: hypothetical protein KJO31_14445 [Gammaproteobacteria bacterium]|nr:hypothetical protein [Gammaproteobacteria bacterium]